MSGSSQPLRLAAAVLIAGAVLFGASAGAHAQSAAGASAVLRDAAGRTVGTVLFTETLAGVRVTLSATGLPPGPHGIHLHAVGLCEPPEFTSAGAHFNPTNRQHGLRNPQGPHAGDLPNLTATATGAATYSAANALVTLGVGASSLFDADGSSLVIHANADDEVTDPTGNSGGRIACGTIARGAVALPATGGGTAAPPAHLVAGALAALGGLGVFLRRRDRRRAP